LPVLAGANESAKTPAGGHFQTARKKKMKKIMTVIRATVDGINGGQFLTISLIIRFNQTLTAPAGELSLKRDHTSANF